MFMVADLVRLEADEGGARGEALALCELVHAQI